MSESWQESRCETVSQYKTSTSTIPAGEDRLVVGGRSRSVIPGGKQSRKSPNRHSQQWEGKSKGELHKADNLSRKIGF